MGWLTASHLQTPGAAGIEGEMKERSTWEKRMVGNQDEWEENQGIPLCASVPGGRLPGVKFSQGALRNPLEHLLGEDSQQLPADVQGFIHCPVVVRA